MKIRHAELYHLELKTNRDAFLSSQQLFHTLDDIWRLGNHFLSYHLERFAEFVAKLAKTPDGEGTLLDNSMLLYGSNMANSNLHTNYPLPNILVGGAAGKLKGGRQVELPERTSISNLHLTVLNKAGLEMKSFGDSTGEIAGV